MSNPVIDKLIRYQRLSQEAVAAMEATFDRRVAIPRGAEVTHSREAGSAIWVLLEGWACRYVLLTSGERQIVGLMTAGDFSDTRIIRLGAKSFGTMAMTDVVVAAVPPQRFHAVLDRHRDIVLAFAKSQLADESIMQTWIANMARKTARQRMAHLLCEMVSRVSRSTNSLKLVIKLPFIQSDFADVLGISPVHVNRVLQQLRAERVIHFRSKWLEVSDYSSLAKIADFDAAYLYYDEGAREAAQSIA